MRGKGKKDKRKQERINKIQKEIESDKKNKQHYDVGFDKRERWTRRNKKD